MSASLCCGGAVAGIYCMCVVCGLVGYNCGVGEGYTGGGGGNLLSSVCVCVYVVIVLVGVC